MIKFIFLVLMFGLVCADGQKPGIAFLKHVPEEDLKACADEIGADLGEDLEGIRKLVHSPEGRQKFPCFSKCLMHKSKMLTDDGTIDMKFVEARMEEFKGLDENAKKSISECVGKTGKIEECDDTLKLVACMPRDLKMSHEE